MLVRTKSPIQAPSSPSATSTAIATSSSSPITPKKTWPSSKPSIGAGDVASGASATPRTPGSSNLPSASFAINEAWLALVLIATDLLSVDARPVPRGRSAKGRAQAPALHPAAQRGHPRALGGAGPPCASPAGWPWADDLVAAFGRLPGGPQRPPERARSASKRSKRPRRDLPATPTERRTRT